MASAFAEAITASIVNQLNPETNMVTQLGQKMVANQEIELDKARREFTKEIAADLRKAKAANPVDDDEVAYLQKLLKKYQS